MRKLSHQEIVQRQNARIKNPRLPFVIVLNNIRSLHNVGSIFRTADGVGAEKIWLCGITGYPPHPQISKTAIGAEGHVPWDYAENALDVIRRMKKEGYQIVLLEQMQKSMDYHECEPKGPVCLIIGNEKEGVSQDLVGLCDTSIEIEMAGIKNSLNVSVAFGIVAYHLRYHLKKINQDYSII